MHTEQEAALSETEQAVLAVVLEEREGTRPAVSKRLRFSAPTVASAMTRLTELNLVSALSARQGALGRAATVYGIAPSAGWTLGLDLGSTQVHAHARGLDGQSIFESTVTLTKFDVEDKVAAIRTLMMRVRRRVGETKGPLYTVGVALPGSSPSTSRPESPTRTARPTSPASFAAWAFHTVFPS